MPSCDPKVKIFYQPKISSTNIEARERVLRGVISQKSVIFASQQSMGRGRRERHWFSPLGGLYFSLVLPGISVDKMRLLAFISGIVIVETLREETGLKTAIKWPNDVLVLSAGGGEPRNQDFKKVAGTLIDNIISAKERTSIIGVGINTNIERFPSNLSRKATSLLRETRRKIDNKKLLKVFVKKFLKKLKGNNNSILNEYKRYDILKGKRVSVDYQNKEVVGDVIGFDKRGALVIKLEKGKIISILEGSIRFVHEKKARR
ncbi:MAG: biotin--[acetyl-CoA-carboxylase] ligase [Patescibacteria group bacterium]